MKNNLFNHNSHLENYRIWLKRLTRRALWVNLTLVLVMVLSLLQGVIPGTPEPDPVSAHNLQTRMVYMFFDPATQACIDARMEGTPLPAGCAPLPVDWALGDPVLLKDDELGVIIKVVPRDGTTTGVGGHIDFYVPNGVQVVDVAYVVPDGAGDYAKVAMKGQSPIAIGAGPIGAKTTTQLVGMSSIYNSPVSSLSSTAVNPASGLHLGTIAGVYGDTGIFYSTDPDTAYGSWQAFNGASTANGCGSLAFNPTALGPTLVNNSGDTVVPCNKWDAEQLMAWGVKGGTFGQSAPIVDYGDGRGNAPWGFASGVAGPQSGYAWQFNWDYWNTSAKDPAAMQTAMATSEIGPWQRIQYNGDRISYDQPGLISTVIGYASLDAGSLGIPVSTLPSTVSQTDTTSPKAVRWAIGQLTAYRPEYAWVKIKVDDNTAGITDPTGCPSLLGDTFGGDAGGTDNGKDHLWRYYEPTEVTMNLCVAAGKPATEELVKSGDIFQYPVKVYNLQDFPLTNVVVKDTLGSGLSLLSVVPAQNSGPNPLVWNVGTLLPGQKFEALVTVKATSTGFLDNCMEVSSDQMPTQEACDTTVSGLYPYLVPSKTVRTSSTAPGESVIYDLLVKNIGEGPTGNPVTVREYMAPGFTYDSTFAPIVHVNGALLTLLPSQINFSNPSEPIFTIPAAIQGGQELTITFQAKVDPAVEPGVYCNTFSATQNGIPITTGSEACVTVAGGKIGDFIWRDWDGDGMQDVGEEGIAGETVKLYESDGTTLKATTTTDANGYYYFNGLEAGTYVVKVNDGTTLTGYTQTGDPDTTFDNMHTVTLAENEQYFTADFGYKPTGAGVIGDKVFEDLGNDGLFSDGIDTGIPNVTVWLYEDTDGDGIITAGVDALVASTTSDTNGDYSFTGLAEGYDYLVKVDKNDTDIASYFANKYGSGTPSMLSTAEVTSSLDLTGSDLDNDFGFWRVMPGSIGDQLFIDADGDRLYDMGEIPVAGVTVNLYRDGVLVASTVSGPDGTYVFENLGPGNYTVAVDGADPDIPGGYFPAIASFNKALAIGENYLDADFPFVALISKSVDKTYAQLGNTLNYSVFVNYPGSELLSDVSVRDYLPDGTSFLSAGQGGTLETFSSTPGIPGVDTGSAGNGSVSLDYTAVDDTWLDGDKPETNYGSTVDLRIDPETSKPEHTVIRFNLPTTLPDDALVTTAALNLTKTSGNTIDISAHQVTNNWAELQASWTNRLTAVPWDTAGGDFSEDEADPVVSSGAATGLRSWSVPHIVQNWLDGAENYGFLLKHPLENIGNNSNVFASSENATLASRPTLTFSYTSTARPATNNTLSVSPDVVAVGSPTTVTMSLTATEAVNYVVPSALAVQGGTVDCTGPTPASLNLAANVAGTFTWICTPSHVGEFTISATASNGTVNFREAISNSLLASPNGENQYVVWELGSNEPGSTGITATSKYLYAFQGDDKLGFWAYSVALASAWNSPVNPADTPTGVTIKEGGALTNDGVQYIYALRGDNSRVFLRYDALTNTWDDSNIADLPATTNKTVLKGGALVYLDGYVYAFLGNDSSEFWRYEVATNTWTKMTNAPAVINEGGSLTTDGTNVYALQGKKQKLFWRYNVSTNSWTALAPTLANIGKGGSLVFANNAIYALRGDGKKSFYRYNIAANTWTALVDFPQSVNEGGSLSFDGSYINALRGNSKEFYRYDFQTWTRLTDTPANVKWGGALTFLATGNVSTTNASAAPTLVSGTADIVLRMTITSKNTVSDITANTPTYTATNGITATFGAPVLKSTDDDISGTGDPVIYEWIATVVPGSLPGEIVFTVSNSLGGTAKSNSVLVTPTLTYQVTVNDTAPPVIYNTAVLNETGGTVENVPSNTTETATSASIGDFVWSDLDGDGMQDAGEYGLPGIKVYVDLDNDGMWDEGEPFDISNANGEYRIFGIEPGTYTVRTDSSTFPDGYVPTTSGSLSVTLVAGEQYNDADFGLQPPPPPELQGSIGDYIWLDANNDGVQDADELPLEGITVRLYRDLDDDGAIDTDDPLVDIVTTDENGLYTFEGLPFASYIVAVDQSSAVTSPNPPMDTYTLLDAMDPTYDKDNGLDNQAAVTVISTTPITDIDFGYNWSGSIGDYVWYDNDRDGVPEEGELPLEGAIVLLYIDANGDGILDPFTDIQVGFDMTDANGAYLFDNLPPGNYLVDVYEDSLTPDGVRDIAPTTANVIAVTLPAGGSILTADFGYYQGARVEGNIFHDDDRNTLFEAGENGLAGITVTITGFDMFGNPVSETTTTDADGHFVFVVPEGDYTLTYATTETTAAGYPDATTTTSYTFHAYPGENWYENTTFDFGVDYAGAIGDRVWNDADGDGIQDMGEVGIAGVTVSLYEVIDVGGTPTEVFLGVTMTDENGNYLFEGLDDGDYAVIVNSATLPAGMNQTFDEDMVLNHRTGVTISSGNTHLTADFGYQYPMSYPISGNVFNDQTNLGVKDGTDPGLPSVTVYLYDSTGTTLLATTTTDASGNYTFPGYPNGSYLVKVDESTLPSTGFYETYESDGSINNAIPITINNAASTGNDFGYHEYLGSISGTVCDGDGDGFCELGEPVLKNVRIILTYAGMDGIIGTADDQTFETQTNGIGNYTFTDLNPGLYQVVEVNPPGYTSLADADGGNPDSITVLVDFGPDGIPNTADDRLIRVDRDFEDTKADIGGLITPDILEVTPGPDGKAFFVQKWINTGELVDRGNITIYDIPDGWGLSVWRDTNLNADPKIGVYADDIAAYCPSGHCLLLATEANGDGVLDNLDTIIAAQDTGSDGIPDSGDLAPLGGAVKILVAVQVPPTVMPGSYALRERGSSNLVWLQLQEEDPTLAYNDESIYHDEAFKVIVIPGAVLGDRVWLDENSDGIQDAGEAGIANVQVTATWYGPDGLLGTADDLSYSTWTDSNGEYSFVNLPGGNYLVEVDVDTLADGLEVNPTYDYDDIGTMHTAVVALTTGQEFDLADFGYNWSSLDEVNGETSPSTLVNTVGDFIWLDADGDGMQDEGEPGIPGVLVELTWYGPDGAPGGGDDVIYTTITDENGQYVFENLPDGTFSLTTALPSNIGPGGPLYGLTPTDMGGDGSSELSLDPMHTSTTGVSDLDQDFGFSPSDTTGDSGVIGDRIWFDTNNDGIQNPGEVGIPGVKITLTDGTTTWTTYTDANGNYTFGDLPAGTFTVTVDTTTLPNGGSGLTNSYDPDAGTPNAAIVTLLTNTSVNLEQDFGYYSLIDPLVNSVGDTVWLDANGNGMQDEGEPGIPGVLVELTWYGPDGTRGTDDDVIYTTITDENGEFLFENLPDGTFDVLIIDSNFNPGGPLYDSENPTYDADGIGTPNISTISIDPNSTDPNPVASLGQDFGYSPSDGTGANGVIGDKIFWGADQLGIPGVLVTLTDGTTTWSTYTDANGYYTFSDLPAGTYTVTVDPINFTAGHPLFDLVNSYDPDGGFNNTSTVTLPTDSSVNLDQDFGYGGTGAIGDRIWSDADGDGRQDPNEPGLGGVTVNLYTDPDGDGIFDTLVATTVTAPDGTYIFDNIAPDAYVIEVVPPMGYTPTGDPDYPGMACPIGSCDSKTTAPILLAPGDVYVNADFGYEPEVNYGAIIGDKVWLDADADGMQDEGEPGIPNVTVALIYDLNGDGTWDEGTEPIIATTITGQYGTYLFTGVPVGEDYLVWVNDTNNVLVGLEPTYDDNGINSANISSVQNLLLTGDLDQDFGYTPAVQTPSTGLIGDTIFLDRDNDGFDPGEGLEGVSVQLYASDGVTLLATTTTDENGNYYFSGLGIGSTYYVKVDTSTLPGGGVGLTNAIDPDGGADSMSLVTITEANKINLIQDFGYTADAPNTISGTVWKDLDGDGFKDPEEVSGLAGVTVVLYDPEGNIVGTTTTDADGNYSFTGLPDGTYYVDVTDDFNVLDGYWKSICPVGYCGLDNYSQSDPYMVTVSGGVTNETADFGYYRLPAEASNFIFYDANWNGIQDAGELGIAGVEVTLTVTYPDGTTTTLVTTSDAEGYYSFGNLLLDENHDGVGLLEPTYLITVVTPDGYLESPSNLGVDDADDSDDGLLGELTQPAMGYEDETNDFGFYGFYHTDLGDAPDLTYKTTRAMNGPAHIFFPDTDQNGQPESYDGKAALWLGFQIDAENDGQPTETANGDNINGNDEDGIDLVNSTEWFEGQDGGTISVDLHSSSTGSNTAFLMVWFDWNHNGTFDNDNKELVVNQTVTWIGATATQEFTFDIPEGIPTGGVESALGADLIYRARLFETKPLNLDTAMTGLVLNGEVEDYNAPVETLPVTMNYFYASRSGNDLVINWSTGRETGNVGFYLLYKTAQGLQSLNQDLIPATGITTHTPQDYRVEFQDFAWVEGGVFYLQDVDIIGRVKPHGPFELGIENGQKVDAIPTDWDAILAEHASLESEREALFSAEVNGLLSDMADTNLREIQTEPETERVVNGYPYHIYLPLIMGGNGTAPEPTTAVHVGDLSVNQTGIYRMTNADLLDAGLNLTGQKAADIALMVGGQPVPMFVHSEPLFGEGSYIEFYGEALDTLYTDTNVYALWVDPVNARRVTLDNTAFDPEREPAGYYMATKLVDINREYDPLAGNTDPWFNTRMMVPNEEHLNSWTYDIEADHYLPGIDALTKLSVKVYGGTRFNNSQWDHHYTVNFNGTDLADLSFDGIEIENNTYVLPSSNLIEGLNKLTITLPADTGQIVDIVYLDHYGISYPRSFWAENGYLSFRSDGLSFQVDNLSDRIVEVFRLQNGIVSKVLDTQLIEQGATYSLRFNGSGGDALYYVVGNSTLLKPGIQPARPLISIKQGKADYLVISHPDFINGLTPLVDARTAQGLTVKVVNVFDVYQQFSYGIFDPQAIADYLKFAAENLGTKYVLLVGDDTFDYRGFTSLGAISFIPSLYAPAGDFVRYTPVDPKYVDFNKDNVPDLPIGRFAVKTTTELANIIAKTLAYDVKDYEGSAVFSADWNYSDESDALIRWMPDGWENTRAYIDFVELEIARSMIIEEINKGVALTSYVGHSDDWYWSSVKEDEIPIFDIYAWDNLTNVNRPTLITQNGCWNVYYISPWETLNDVVLNQGLTGAAAMFGSTTLTSDLNEQRMGDYFIPLLTQPGLTIGDALTMAKQLLAAEDSNTSDVLLGWTLLGDPYLKVAP